RSTQAGHCAMRISHFFIDRPIFACVLSIVFVILGAVAYARLPVAQYPEIAPPIINVTGQYPGASADIVASTVVAPIEEQINGVESMLYMSSNSTADGRFSIAVSFDLGTNLDIAQVQVQNRVAIAQPRLPADVRLVGVTVTKSSPDLMLVVHLYSPDKSRDALFISNYATLEIKDALTRIEGVGSITVFGSRDYAMRVWLDPDRLQSLGLTAGDVTLAMQGQNIQVASGVLNQPPVDRPGAFQVAVKTLGRLADPEEFGSIVVKQSAAAVVRLRDVAMIELAALDYSSNSYLNVEPAVALAVFQRPGSNALSTSDTIRATMEELSKRFPLGLTYTIIYDPPQFFRQSVDGVQKRTLRGFSLFCSSSFCSCRAGAQRSSLLWRYPSRLSARFSSWPFSDSRSTISVCSAWCWRSALWWTMPSWSWRTSSATSPQVCRPAKPPSRA